ncbi:DUF4339 domain-containing protein [Rufibacter sediminis]|uniref:DUF4339 domain-containing protein n=1 Tax=Rufibacter sediminis TaxID=2762756 RepID=A0ABR6VQ34_9BACT|nr:DUF4339 domain-containing protein [Rufibacter sediminis]MBC3539040.1 DUF4339 domain-containing protein [Rufibacter sediminis]
METKDYYYLKEEEQVGPVKLTDLKIAELTPNDFIWFEDLDGWMKIKDIPELSILFKPKTPPPPPKVENLNKTEISGEILVKKEKIKNETIEAIKPTNKALHTFLIWAGIHFFALITSYSEVDIFNVSKPRTDKFWPFVEYIEKEKYWEWTSTPPPGQIAVGGYGEWREETDFNGIFYNYDWSEFLVFVGGALFFYLLSKLSDKNDKNTSANIV